MGMLDKPGLEAHANEFDQPGAVSVLDDDIAEEARPSS